MNDGRRRYYDDDDDDVRARGDSTGGLIPYKNTFALLAYYFGVFSLIPCLGLILGVAAFILGIMGIRAYNQNPRVAGAVHAWIGIILGGFMALAHIAVIGLIVVAPILAQR